MTDPLPEGPPAVKPLNLEEVTRYERIGKIYGHLKASTPFGDWAITKAEGLAGVEFLWGGEIEGQPFRFAYTIRYDQVTGDKHQGLVNQLATEIMHEWHRKVRRR